MPLNNRYVNPVGEYKNAQRGVVAEPERLVGVNQPGEDIPVNFVSGMLQAMIEGPLADVPARLKR